MTRTCSEKTVCSSSIHFIGKKKPMIEDNNQFKLIFKNFTRKIRNFFRGKNGLNPQRKIMNINLQASVFFSNKREKKPLQDQGFGKKGGKKA